MKFEMVKNYWKLSTHVCLSNSILVRPFLFSLVPASGAKNQIKALVEKCLKEAKAALAALQNKIKSANAAKKSAQDKINKLEHSKTKCMCDAQQKQLLPLVQRATQKIKDNNSMIDAIDK